MRKVVITALILAVILCSACVKKPDKPEGDISFGTPEEYFAAADDPRLKEVEP